MIGNITEGAKVEVPQVREAVEPDLLYPLLRGRDISRWQAQPSAYILVPQDPAEPSRAYPEADLQRDYPRTYGYLKRFEQILRNRSGYKQILSRRETEFYGLMDIDHYTFAPWKVVWTRVGRDIVAATAGPVSGPIGAKPIIPIETAVFIPLHSKRECMYVCAVVNSTPWRALIDCTSVHGTGGFGSPNVLEKGVVPSFDPALGLHLKLADLSRAAHEAAAAGDEESVAKIEAEIDELAAKLWGLTQKELQAIRDALEIMS